MKPTQLKDALRNIWKQKVSYLSIIVIAFLGVTTFLGIDYSDAALRRNGSRMYNECHFRDIEIISTTLLSLEDLDSIAATEGVARAEAVWLTDAKVTAGDTRQDVQVISLPEGINLPELVEGRLPENETECAVEQGLAKDLGLQIGDEIHTLDAKGETAPYLLQSRFVITGIANHPDHTSVSIPDTLYVLVKQEAFDHEALQNCFMKAEIEIEKPEEIDRFSKDYDAAVALVFARLEELAGERSPKRDSEIRDQYQAEIDEGQSALASGQAELDSARAKLDQGWGALAEGEGKLAENEEKLSEADQKLAEGWQKLLDARAQLLQAAEELTAAKALLDAGAAELATALQQIADARLALYAGWNALEDAKAEIRGMIRSKLEAIVGDTSGLIPWAGRMDVNVDNVSASASEFWLTTGFKLDLDRSLAENILSFIYSGQIPDEILEILHEQEKAGGG